MVRAVTLLDGVLKLGNDDFASPQGIAVNSLGDVYVAELMSNRVVRFSDLPATTTISLTTSSKSTSEFGTTSLVSVESMTIAAVVIVFFVVIGVIFFALKRRARWGFKDNFPSRQLGPNECTSQ